MQVIAPGHEYHLVNQSGNKIAGTLQFIHKKDGKLLKDGTTSEEVLKVLIDRIEHLDTVVKSKHNKTTVEHLKKALAAMEARSVDRIKRGVEGSDKK